MPPELPSYSLGVIRADLFCLDMQEYIVVVDFYSDTMRIDYFSGYPEALTLTKTLSVATTEALKLIFAHHEIPARVRSDNGPQLLPSEFQAFARNCGFQCYTSIPKVP